MGRRGLLNRVSFRIGRAEVLSLWGRLPSGDTIAIKQVGWQAVVFVDLYSFLKASIGSLVTHKAREYFVAVGLAALCMLGLLHEARAQAASYPGSELMAKAGAARMQNDLPDAIALYSQAVANNPKLPDAWWFLGSLQYATGAYGPARDALSHYLELTPNGAPALALRGLCEFETQEYGQALSDIERGISLGAANQPRNEQILRYHEALLLTRLGNYEGALRAYVYFAKNGISNPELLVAIGLAGLRTPLLPKDVTSDDAPLLSAAGSAAFQFLAGDETSATESFERIFESFPKSANTHFLYGYLLFATDPAAALAQFKQELAVSPDNVDAKVMTAWGLLLENRAADALPYAQAAAEKQPSNPTAELVLGRSLLETGDLNGGVERLQKVTQMDPDNLEAHVALAKAYSKSGHKEDARHERMLCLQLSNDTSATAHR